MSSPARRGALAMLRPVGWLLAPLLNFVLRLTKQRSGVALAYHTIDQREGDADRELVPPLERSRFRRQLRHLARHYEIVPVDQFLEAIAARRRGQRFPVCLTFDDDQPEHVRHAMPELLQQGAPAIFFLCGARLAGEGDFWWRRVQRAVDRGVPVARINALLPPGLGARLEGNVRDIHRVALAIEDLPPAQRDEVNASLLSLSGPDPADALISAEQIATLARAGFQIGFHTLRHDRLTGLDDAELERAMRENRAALASVAEHELDAIAYPHGPADRRVAEAARRAGFQLGFTAEPIAATLKSDPLMLGRVGDVDTSLGIFALRIVHTLISAEAQG